MHIWVNTGNEGTVSCIECGGEWEADANDDIVAANGDHPTACLGVDTCHGDPVEYGDEVDDPRYDHECNCLLCQ